MRPMTGAHVRNALNTKNTLKIADAELCFDAKYQCLSDCAEVVLKCTSIRVEGGPKPTRGDISSRDKPISANGSSVIGTFVTQISTMTIHMLHGKAQYSGNYAPFSNGFTISNANTTINKNQSSPTIIMAKFHCNGTIFGRKGYLDLDPGRRKSGAGRQECASQDRLFCTRGRRQE